MTHESFQGYSWGGFTPLRRRDDVARPHATPPKLRLKPLFSRFGGHVPGTTYIRQVGPARFGVDHFGLLLSHLVCVLPAVASCLGCWVTFLSAASESFRHTPPR
jgi:hypothetical protein